MSRRALQCLMAICALHSVALVMSPAKGQDRARPTIPLGTVVCTDQQAADELITTVRDPDAEVFVRRMMLVLSTGGCSDGLAGEGYEPMEVEPSGIVKARVRGSLPAYLVPLAAIHSGVSARSP